MIQLNFLKPAKVFADSPAGVDMADVEVKLPESLRRLLSVHDDASEYFMGLMTIIVISGGIMSEVWATYARRRIFSMLMLFVVCPPAGGKGVVSLGSKLLERIDAKLSERFKAAMINYLREMDIYRSSLKAGSPGVTPVKPKRSQLLVPGNITASKLIQQLADNEPLPLVIAETEAEVVGVSFKSDHGLQLSTILRQVFHHEKVGLSRKTNDEVIEVLNPKCGVLLAGTDNQLMSIFRGNEDGLYSRFLFLRGVSSMKWRSVKPTPIFKSLDDHYAVWSEWFYKVWQQTQNFRAEVRFTDRQWDLLDERGEEQQATAHLMGGDYSISIARRHALMVIRMAMTLSFFRRVNAETGVVDTSVSGWICDDVDFELALTLTKVSFQQSLELFLTMPQHPSAQITNTKRMAFFNVLPVDFDMKVANAIAQRQGIPERTKTRWIGNFCDTGMLEQINRGEYKKTALATTTGMALNQINT